MHDYRSPRGAARPFLYQSSRPDLYHVYVLRSGKTGRFYTGSCEDLDKRLAQHNVGQSKATRHGTPWQLVYHEDLATRAEAVQRERYLKTGRGRDEVRARLV